MLQKRTSFGAILCDDVLECADMSITDNVMACISFQSCANGDSLITTDGYIQCSAAYSCFNNELISTPNLENLALGSLSNVKLSKTQDSINCSIIH